MQKETVVSLINNIDDDSEICYVKIIFKDSKGNKKEICFGICETSRSGGIMG